VGVFEREVACGSAMLTVDIAGGGGAPAVLVETEVATGPGDLRRSCCYGGPFVRKSPTPPKFLQLSLHSPTGRFAPIDDTNTFCD
jgi:hypothetical protein